MFKRVNSSVAPGTGTRRKGHATSGQFIQSRQRLGHNDGASETYDLSRAQDKFFGSKTDGGERGNGIAHQLDGLRKETHLIPTLFRLLHQASYFSDIGKFPVSQCKTYSCHDFPNESTISFTLLVLNLPLPLKSPVLYITRSFLN